MERIIKKYLGDSGNKELTKLSTLDEYFVEEIQVLIELEFQPFHLEDLVGCVGRNLAIEGRLNNTSWSEVALINEESIGMDDLDINSRKLGTLFLKNASVIRMDVNLKRWNL